MKKMMRKYALVLAFGLAISPAVVIGGCQQFTSAATSPQTIATAEKSLTVAHLAYNSLGTIILNATQTGVLKGSAAAQVKVYYDKAGDALLVADKADQAANSVDLYNAVLLAQDAIASASKLIGSK